MTNRTVKWLALVPALAVLLAGAAARAEKATGEFERTLAVTGAVDLKVENGSGHLIVRPGASHRVRVVGRIEARTNGWRDSGRLTPEEKVRRIEANPPIEQSGNTIRIGRIEDEDLRRNLNINYEIEVPKETALKAHTGSGHQEITGIRGPVSSSSGSGHLEISDISGTVDADTGSGHIELADIQGQVTAETGSGHITANRVPGPFAANTGSGSVTVDLSVPGAVEITTGSGSVEVSGARGAVKISTGSGSIRVDGEPTAGWKLNTGSGSIGVRVPPNSAFELEARSHSGTVRTSHPVTVVGAIKRNQLRGSVRGGGPILQMETGSGSIDID
jgi:DUF4097 and DUF4098 domain-containing protein YvlB